MDIQYILTINLMIVSALVIVSVLMQLDWRDHVLWLVVNAAVIAVGAAGLQWWPDSAGTLAALVFVPFVMAPLVLSALTRRSTMQNRPGRAALYARLGAILHPTARTRFNAAVAAAHAEPTPETKRAALAAIARTASPGERFQLEALQLRFADDWRGVLNLIRRSPYAAPQLGGLEIRALGELGEVDQMVRAFEESRDDLVGSDFNDALLVLLAFSGRPGPVVTVLERNQSTLQEDAKTYWLAVAQQAAGAHEGLWRPPLESLAESASSAETRQRAARKLRHPAEQAQPLLTAAAEAIVDQAIDRLERQQPRPQRTSIFATPVTYTMLLAYLAAYVMEERSGGSQSLRALVELGALWPPYVIDRGEWWRLLTATFLHYGPLHVGANGLMLYLLGRPCELSFGWPRMLVLYLAGALASSAFVLGLYVSGLSEPTVLVGASGAVMAVFGGLVGHRLVTWLRHRDIVDRRFLSMVPVILALQFAADLSMPQVSLAAHASGFFAGLVVGTLLALTMRRQGNGERSPATAGIA